MSNRADRRAAERAAQNQTTANARAFMDAIQQSEDDCHHEEDSPAQTHAAAASSAAAPEPKTASAAQINANRENAQKSTGPTSPEGRFLISQNRRSHGLTGRFILQGDENPIDYESLVDEVYEEYQPQTATEVRLAHAVIQHYWMVQRAILLQEQTMNEDKKLALYMRYQTTHERSYYKAQKELQKLVKERAKEQIGFESQKQKEEKHEAAVRLTHAKAEQLETDSACRQVMEAPMPNNEKISFAELAKACSAAIAALVIQKGQHHSADAAA